MEWANESGGAYGGEPYDGAGRSGATGHGYGATAEMSTMYGYGAGPELPATYGYGTSPELPAMYGYGASPEMSPMHGHGADPGTSSASWDRWAPPVTGHGVTGTGPGTPAMPLHAAGPDPAAPPRQPWQPWEPWDHPHGDVLAVPPLPPDSGAPPEDEPVRPVFVDSSGRRQRHVRRAARLLVIPAGGYVALLIGTMLGGPSISSPFVPRADPAHPAAPRATAADSPPGTGHSTQRASATAARHTSPGRATAPTVAAPAPTAAPTRTASRTATATSGPAHARFSKGRALGASHKPPK